MEPGFYDAFEKIEYLDWQPDGIPSALRDRAAAAYREMREEEESGRAEREHDLQRLAYEKIAEVLEETNGTDVVTKVTDPNDGDGNVELTIDGMRFKVGVVFYPNTPERDPMVNLSVQGTGGWLSLSSIASLGKYISDGKIKEAT